MIIKPLIRSNMCINAHPKGCAADVKHQIEFIEKKFTTRNIPADAPKTVLVLGCSTGYGLASRIVAAFGYKAITIGVSFEKEGSDGGIGESREKTGTPGWYNNMAFDKFAKEAGLESVTFNGDAFSHEMRQNVIDTLKASLSIIFRQRSCFPKFFFKIAVPCIFNETMPGILSIRAFSSSG